MTQAQDPAAGGNPAFEDDETIENVGVSGPSAGQDLNAQIHLAEAAVIARADEKGGLFPLNVTPKPYGASLIARLPDPAQEPALFRPATALSAAEDAETELTGIIAECRFLMREVAFHSARLTPDPEVRLQFIDSACRLAETGARVAEGVARLRGGPRQAEESRKTFTYEVLHRAAPLPGPGEGGTP